jgi:hypothetical protein
LLKSHQILVILLTCPRYHIYPHHIFVETCIRVMASMTDGSSDSCNGGRI